MATVNERVRVDFGTVASVIVLERSDVVTLEHPLPLYVSCLFLIPRVHVFIMSRMFCPDVYLQAMLPRGGYLAFIVKVSHNGASMIF